MTLSVAPAVLFSTQQECINAATNAIKDYRSTMEKVVESWLKNELGTIEQLAEAIGRSPKTLKTDYVSALRKQGRLPQAMQGKRSGTSKNKCRKSGTSVENSEPEIEQVTVTVNNPPASTPTPTPSVPSAGHSTPREEIQVTPTGKLNEHMEILVKREGKSGKDRLKIAAALIELQGPMEKTMKAASRDFKRGPGIVRCNVQAAERQLAKDGQPSIKETLEDVRKQAQLVWKYADESLRLLQFQQGFSDISNS